MLLQASETLDPTLIDELDDDMVKSGGLVCVFDDMVDQTVKSEFVLNLCTSGRHSGFCGISILKT